MEANGHAEDFDDENQRPSFYITEVSKPGAGFIIHKLRKSTVIRPLCLVESYSLDAAVRRERSLFTSLTVCNVIFSCSLIPKENIRCVHLPVFY